MKSTEPAAENSATQPLPHAGMDTGEGAPPGPPSPEPEAAPAESPFGSYRRILSATSIVGGASAIGVIISIVRSKFTALVLGPAGVGLASQYLVAINLFTNLSKCGTDISGARQIAASNGANDLPKVGRIFISLRRLAIVLGLLGTIGMVIFAAPLSAWSLGESERYREIFWIAPAIIMGAVAGSHVALIQGMRRIGDFARISVAGNLSGLIVAIPLYLHFDEKGVAPALTAGTLTSLLVSWYYARRVALPRSPLAIREMREEAKPILGMGIALMTAGLVQSASNFIARGLITTDFGIAGVGQFSAAYSLSVVYANQILNATGADFLPRLSEIADDDARLERTVNEQSEIVLHMALPGVLGTIGFAPLAVYLFYSSAFEESISLLRWHLLGVLAWVAHWPLDLAMIARGKARTYSAVQMISGVLYAALVFAGIRWFGLMGVGIAYTLLHLLHLMVAFIILRNIADFRWSRPVTILFALAITVAGLSFSIATVTPPVWGFGINAVLLAATTCFCVRSVASRAGIHTLGQVIDRIKIAIGRS